MRLRAYAVPSGRGCVDSAGDYDHGKLKARGVNLGLKSILVCVYRTGGSSDLRDPPVDGDTHLNLTEVCMSFQAVAWVFLDAPIPKPSLVAPLAALAENADDEGRQAYPSQALLAYKTRKTDRGVRKDLVELERLGLITRGDQRVVAHIPEDRRPVVWDLALHLHRDDPSPVKRHRSGGSSSPKNRPEPQFPPDVDNSASTGTVVPVDAGTGGNHSSGAAGTTVPTNHPRTSPCSEPSNELSLRSDAEAPQDAPPDSTSDDQGTLSNGEIENLRTEEPPSEPVHRKRARLLLRETIPRPVLTKITDQTQRTRLVESIADLMGKGWREPQIRTRLSGCVTESAYAPYAILRPKIDAMQAEDPPSPNGRETATERPRGALSLMARPCGGRLCGDDAYAAFCDGSCPAQCDAAHPAKGQPGSCPQCGPLGTS